MRLVPDYAANKIKEVSSFLKEPQLLMARKHATCVPEETLEDMAVEPRDNEPPYACPFAVRRTSNMAESGGVGLCGLRHARRKREVHR